MLSDLLYFALAYFYKNRNSKLGINYLLKQTEFNLLPDEFKDWWKLNRETLLKLCTQWGQYNINVTYPGCWDYPNKFLEKLENPPILLFYRGAPVWVKKSGTAVVGSRKITPQSKKWLDNELFTYVRDTKDIIISGGAQGIDQEAHLQALRNALPTVVILPSGLQKLYPKVLNEWQDSVLKNGGALLSEYFPDQEMQKFHFIQRNRLIATMGSSVLIVQGERRSGTMLTAKLALELNQVLGVIPGHPMDSAYSGNQEVLKWGATPIIDSKDLICLNYNLKVENPTQIII